MKIKENIILAFDGPDNVGKGTQIKKIRKFFKETPFVVLNIEAPVGNNNKEKLEYGLRNTKNNFNLMRLAVKNNIPLILDRSHFSEYAYSFLRGGHQIEDILELEKDFKRIRENLFIITFIDRAKNIAQRDDGLSAFDPENLEQIDRIIKNFQEISKESIFKNVILDIEGKDEEKVFEELLKEIKKIV